MRVLFVYLKAFSLTGGIEKFNRSLLKALNELNVQGNIKANAISSHDATCNENYFDVSNFKSYKGNKLFFILAVLRNIKNFNTLIVGHLNLAPVAWLAKRIKPSIQLIIVAHGIEAWQPQVGIKKKILQQANIILCVSNFTKQQLINNNEVDANKIKIFHNTIDPFFLLPTNFNKPEYLLERYGISKQTKILLTLTRLSNAEQYKGYDTVLSAMPCILEHNKNLVYLIVGKADAMEKKRVEILIEEKRLSPFVKLIGFIDENELIDHYLLADVFVMPSKNEGFGIVFIEAAACGKPVIAGNTDGSTDALLNGALGLLINTNSITEVCAAVNNTINNEQINPLQLQKKVMENFSFDIYKEKLKTILAESLVN